MSGDKVLGSHNGIKLFLTWEATTQNREPRKHPSTEFWWLSQFSAVYILYYVYVQPDVAPNNPHYFLLWLMPQGQTEGSKNSNPQRSGSRDVCSEGANYLDSAHVVYQESGGNVQTGFERSVTKRHCHQEAWGWAIDFSNLLPNRWTQTCGLTGVWSSMCASMQETALSWWCNSC